MRKVNIILIVAIALAVPASALAGNKGKASAGKSNTFMKYGTMKGEITEMVMRSGLKSASGPGQTR